MRPARPPARRLPGSGLPARLATAVALGALITAALPALHVAAKGPIDVRGREISAAVDRQRLIPLPFEASHVALRWTGTHDDVLSIAFGQRPNELGEEVPVGVDEDAEGEPGEVFSGVIWTGGARFARITTSRPIGALRLLVMDATGGRGALGLGLGSSADGGGFVASAAVPMPPIISRAGWNANEAYRFDSGGYERFAPSFTPLQKVIVHHTAGRNDDPDPEATIRAIYYMHAVSRGYGDIDYNYLIDWQGRVYEGRHSRDYGPGEPITAEDLAGNAVRGAHARDFNDGTVGIALLGTFTNRLPPPAQRAALEQLIAWKLERHGINPLGAGTYVNTVLGNTKHLKNISGHRDVNATSCPGGVFYDWFPTLRQNVANRIAATTGSEVDHTAPAVESLATMIPDPSGATTIPFGLIFEEPVDDLAVEDLSLGGTSTGWAIESVAGTASAYQVIVRAAGEEPPTEGTIELTLAPESVADLGGNLGPLEPAVAATTYAPDESPPSVVLWQTPHKSASNAEFFDWTVTFSEPVQGFELEDVVIGGPDADEWLIERILGSGASYIFTTKQPALSNGVFTVSIPEGAATDLAGNPVVASAIVTLKVDRSAPTTGVPALSLRSGTTLSGGSLRGQLALRGTDTGPAGIGSFEVRRSVDGGGFTTIATGVTARYLNVTLAPGHSYRFEARARDKAGNLGGWRAGATVKPALVQQGSSALRWSGSTGWASGSGYSGGSTRYLRAGASVTYTTSARAIAFVTTKGPNRGTARVYVDGALAATIDLGAPTWTYRFVAFSKRWSSRGTHTIRIVSDGAEAYPRVDVDAFGVIR